MKWLVSLSCLMIILLGACGTDGKTASKVEEPKPGERQSSKENEEGTGLEAFEDKNFEFLTAEDWENINLSKKQFDLFLKDLSEGDENGEMVFNKAEMVNDSTIEIIFNNSDGDALVNTFTAPILDASIRELYKHSAYFKNEEPTIIYSDLTGFEIAKITEQIDLDDIEEGDSGEDLGTFQLGDKIDVAGTIITLKEAKYTDERNKYADEDPKEVLVIDMDIQNATDEEIYFDTYDFEVYDADGTKMSSYPIDSLSDTLQPGKNISGYGAYGVSGKGPYEVYYKDFMTNTKAMWKIEVK